MAVLTDKRNRHLEIFSYIIGKKKIKIPRWKSNRHRSKFPKGPNNLNPDRQRQCGNINEFVLLEQGSVAPTLSQLQVVARSQELVQVNPSIVAPGFAKDSCTTNIHLQVGVAPLLRGFLELQQETCQWEALSMFKAQRRFLLLWQCLSSWII